MPPTRINAYNQLWQAMQVRVHDSRKHTTHIGTRHISQQTVAALRHALPLHAHRCLRFVMPDISARSSSGKTPARTRRALAETESSLH